MYSTGSCEADYPHSFLTPDVMRHMREPMSEREREPGNLSKKDRATKF
jgi:hypothetical protein